MIRTKKFIGLMDRIGKLRITKPVSWLLVYLMPVSAGIAMYFFLSQLTILFSPRGQQVAQVVRSIGPLANIGIPGINPYLPIVYGWIAVIVAVVIHEAAHGIVARSIGLRVKSSGLLFFLFIPIGAFVEVDDTQLANSRFRDSSRVLGAGSGINLVIAILSLLILLFAVVPSMVPKADGIAVIGVVSNSPAEKAGIMPGDFIISINGSKIDNPEKISQSSWYKPGVIINMTVYRDGTIINKLIKLGENPYNKTLGYVGVSDQSYSQLVSAVSYYSSALFKSPFLYFCIPTLPQCQQTLTIPFTSPLYVFYDSPLGSLLVPISNLLYWMFFVNFNLAIFNSLPIYLFDGGQAFRLLVKTIGGKRLSETTLNTITNLAGSVLLLIILFSIFGPYLAFMG